MLYANTNTKEFGLTRRKIKLSNPRVSFPIDSPPSPWIAYTESNKPSSTLTHDPVEVFPVDGVQTWEMVEVSVEEQARRQSAEENREKTNKIESAKQRIIDIQAEKLLNDPNVPTEDKELIGNVVKEWESGEKVGIGDHRRYNDILYRCIQAHVTATRGFPPDRPTLWVRAFEPGEIPDWVQPAGAHDAYQLDQKVKHNGVVWISMVENNVWEPGAVGSNDLWNEVQE